MDLNKIQQDIIVFIMEAMKKRNVNKSKMYVILSENLYKEIIRNCAQTFRFSPVVEHKTPKTTFFNISVLVDEHLPDGKFRIMYNDLGG